MTKIYVQSSLGSLNLWSDDYVVTLEPLEKKIKAVNFPPLFKDELVDKIYELTEEG